jgi:hypothetical protein
VKARVFCARVVILHSALFAKHPSNWNHSVSPACWGECGRNAGWTSCYCRKPNCGTSTEELHNAEHLFCYYNISLYRLLYVTKKWMLSFWGFNITALKSVSVILNHRSTDWHQFALDGKHLYTRLKPEVCIVRWYDFTFFGNVFTKCAVS